MGKVVAMYRKTYIHTLAFKDGTIAECLQGILKRGETRTHGPTTESAEDAAINLAVYLLLKKVDEPLIHSLVQSWLVDHTSGEWYEDEVANLIECARAFAEKLSATW